jgi:hypothetical protein
VGRNPPQVAEIAVEIPRRAGLVVRRYGQAMPRRTRIAAFGSAGGLVVAGAICIALIDGLAGQVLAIALVGLGLGGALLLAFFEVGLSEDQDRAREKRRR